MSFPAIARVVHTTKEYKAKVPETMRFTVLLDHNGQEREVQPVNISIGGISLSLDKKLQRELQTGDVMPLRLLIDEKEVANVAGSVRHLARIRKDMGVQHLCGISFDQGSKAAARAIESTVAAVQRAHLKELAEKSDASGIKLVV